MNKIKILFIEDYLPDYELIKREIVANGIQYFEKIVETKDTYIQALRTYKPDIILSDYSLPMFNGMQALLIRNELAPMIPFILITGSINEEVAVDCMKSGADDYIIKENLKRLSPAIIEALKKQEILHAKKEAEDALHGSEELFRKAFENSAAGVCILSLKGKFVRVNSTLCQMLGYTKEKLLELTYTDITYKEDEWIGPYFLDKMISGMIDSANYQKRYVHKSGKVVWADISTSIVKKTTNKPAYFLVNIIEFTERKLAEDALRESEERFKLLFDKAPLGYQSLDINGNLIEVNETWLETLGYSKQEVVGKWFGDFLSPDFVNAFRERFNLFKTLGSIHSEFEMIKKDGTPIFIAFDGRIGHKPSGEFKQTHCVLKDITEQKEMEKQLQIKNAAIESSMSAIGIADMNGKLIYVNEAYLKMWGYDNINELIGLNLNESEQSRKNVLEVLTTLKKGKGYIGEVISERKDHSIFEVQLAANLIKSAEGKPLYLMASYIDITKRKRAEKELEKSNRKLNTIVNNLRGVIYNCIYDDNWTMEFISDGILELSGYPADDFINNHIRSYASIIYPGDQSMVWNKIHDAIQNKHNYTLEYRITTSSNEIKWVWESGRGVFDQHKLLSLEGYISDITERKKAEEELLIAKVRAEENDRLKTAFLHNISHEIRTPMNAIIGFSNFLNKPDLEPDKRQHFTDIICNSSRQLLSIITDIINIATIESGQEKINENEVNLNLLLKNLNIQFENKAQKRNIGLICEEMLSDDKALIHTDEIKLLQILTNLLGNALKFTLQGQVNYGYRLQNDQLEFYVADTGIGIPKDKQEEIFDRFRQADSTIASQFGGTGLGLSISKAYVELLKGRLWIESEPGKGSTFHFTIPYNPVVQKETLFINPNRITKLKVEKPKTILIAEDEDHNFMLLKEILTLCDIKIIRVKDGIEAVEICKLNPQLDLVIMDIKMPLMDGYEATKKIKAFRPNLPIIAQTAYADERDKDKALSCGCNDYISKPIDSLKLMEILQKLLKD
jgi:PAS domain S-box-containing protein